MPKNYFNYYNAGIASQPGQGYYKYMRWGMARAGGAYDFTAEGDKRQFIYVSPHKNLGIVRNGIEYGTSAGEWFKLFYNFASQY